MFGVVAVIGAAGGAVSGDVSGAANATIAQPAWAAARAPSGSLLAGRRGVVVSRSAPRQAMQSPVRVASAAERRAKGIEQLEAAAEVWEGELQDGQWALPMTSYRLTGRFGQSSYLWSTIHTGLDFAAPTGTPVLSVGAGTVSEAGYAGSYGYRTIITLLDGTEIWYCHQSQIDVNVGESVSRGEPVGLVGSTGNVTGPHLHLEVRPGGGDPVDPYSALAERGAQP